ncbi:MAG: DUF4231 domain-containing protein [Acidobacteriota bacterium]|nr:DUF4231 domain-containing protein [Acidobacteriota bacterium]
MADSAKQDSNPSRTEDAPPQDPSPNSGQITLNRLEQQIDWYDRRSKLNQILYKSLKTMTLAAAAAIPLLTTSGAVHANHFAAGLGVLISLLEGIQQLNQYHTNWTSYRTTAEALKHEKYFFLGQAGFYLKSTDPHALLAERIEALVSQENSKWFLSQAQTANGDLAKAIR